MKIIAHRGMWLNLAEKNTPIAFKRALEHGFGIETDFRDYDGRLVISHDLPDSESLDAEIFFDLCNQHPNTDPHAINVKSDGLQTLLATYLERWPTDHYFIFDMSVPDTMGYLRHQLNSFSRVSEYEDYQNFDGKTKGIWVDGFMGEWYNQKVLQTYLQDGQSLAIVSPELHDRSYQSLWAMIKAIDDPNANLMLCTDRPLEARRYFNE
jgi:glycerophosphoryl diester phosphodiesterase